MKPINEMNLGNTAMKRAGKKFLLVAIIFLYTFNLHSQYELVEIIPGFDYGSWYKAETGYNPNPQWFGAWVIAPHNDELYFGFATARPAEAEGAFLAKLMGDTLVVLGQFDEQGVHCLLWNKDTLYSMGSDPSHGDGWDGGNFYKYNSFDGFKKIRYNEHKKPVLPNVIHSWGLYFDTLSNKFLMATGSYDPVQYSKNGGNCGNANDSTLACFGEIWQSSDYGYTWELISGKKPDVISPFRAMDVIMYNNDIYEFNHNMNDPSDMKKSSNNGLTWIEVPGVVPSVLFRMCVFQNKLLAAANLAKKLYAIDENSNSSTITMPGAFNYSFNVFANVEDRYLITYFSDGSVYATANLFDWIEIIPATGKNFLSIAYWEKEKSIVLAQRDSIGKIWKVDISELIATDVKTALNNNEPTFSQYEDNVIINNLEDKSAKVEIYNILGMNISKSANIIKNFHSVRVSTVNLPNGLYIVEFNYHGKYMSFKFIK